MTGRRVHVGRSALQGHLERYAKTFDLLEVKTDPAPPPAKVLRRMRQQVPDGFSFSVVAPRALCELGEEPDAARVAVVRGAASELGARFVVIRTPASVTPSARSRARFVRLVDALRGAAPSLAWEPRGIWTDEEIAIWAAELDLLAVRDLAEQEPAPGPVIYTRVLALGRNSRVGSGAIERIGERIEDAEEAFVVVEGQGAANVAKQLKGEFAATDDEDDASEEDGDDDGFDDAEAEESDDEAADDEDDEE